MLNPTRHLLLGLLCALSPALFAATPESGTISPASPQADFEAGPFLDAFSCGSTCETYQLTAELPGNLETTDPGAMIRFGFAWAGKLELFFTFTITDEDTGEELVSSSSSDLGSQTLYIPAGEGTRRLRVDIGSLTPQQSVVLGRINLIAGDSAGLRPNPIGPGVPRYQVYAPPEGLSGNTGEPSVGYNQSSGQSFILSGLKTLWLDYPQNLTPALPQACEGAWENRSSPVTSVTTLDPIGITDSLVRGHETTRTIIGQLAGANSAAAYSDDDGATWIPVEGGPPVSAVDHQTYGAGPYPASHPFGIVPNPIYPNAVYYCGQDIAFASCARSDNGGISFGPATIAYSVQQCAGIHGHVRVAPDGTVYIPQKACDTGVAVTVSEDAGTTWEVRPVPGSRPAIRDPSVALATDNTAYFCYANGDGRATVSVSKDRGLSWAAPVELGAEMGIKHVMFTHAIAGDPDRATCAYVGTTTTGNPVSMDFPGVWHLYFSTTYDGGLTWTTVNATPNDPVQGVGGIWNSGGGAVNRNLLDFNEMSIDERGFPIYGYADGCIGACDTDPTYNTFAAFPKIARQIAGKSLYAEFDSAEPRISAEPCLAGTRTPERTQLTWKAPENGGAAISQYRVFRGTAPGSETFVGTTNGTPGYVDLGADPNVPVYYYKVTALNSEGESVFSNTVELPITIPEVSSVCGLPGKRMITDATGDSQTGENTDLVSLHISEPPEAPGKIIFQLKLASLATPNPGTMYAVQFHTPDQPLSNPNDRFVGMLVEGATPSFVYGSRTEQVVGVAVIQTYSVEGTLDAASGFTEDGTITLVLPRETFGLEDGGRLGVFSINVHAPATSESDYLIRSTNILDAADTGEPYVLRSADFCAVNTAPFARLAALPAIGPAPLDVVLDASSSSDSEDSIVEYVFDPGDATPQVTQTTPRFAHRYTERGFYRATVQVKDARGQLSANVAQIIVDTTGAASNAGADKGRFGSGALSVALLLPLLGAALRRRRR